MVHVQLCPLSTHTTRRKWPSMEAMRYISSYVNEASKMAMDVSVSDSSAVAQHRYCTLEGIYETGKNFAGSDVTAQNLLVIVLGNQNCQCEGFLLAGEII
jgi:hypothetical protein